MVVEVVALKIGILAVQGDFEAHAALLQQLGAQTTEVRTPADLAGCAGLILPGGESTTPRKFVKEEGRADKSVNSADAGGSVFRTSPGRILVAKDGKHPDKRSSQRM